MVISTRGRYALRVMADLAEHRGEGFVPMRQVAERQGISLKYLEKILPSLVSAGLIEGVHGKGGGYRLTREPVDYKVSEILRLTEGDFIPVSCLECGPTPCDRAERCYTRPLWDRLTSLIDGYLSSVTLDDLLKGTCEGERPA